jgi:hypothetical protein
VIGRWTVLNGVLVAIVVLLGLQITRTWMRTVPPLRVPVAAGAGELAARRDPKVKAPLARDGKTEEDVVLITSMDLFDQSRQPVGAAGSTAPAPVEVPPPTGIDVVGIRLLSGDEEAFIRDASQQNGQRRVREGDEVAGYTVQAINPTNVELGNATGQTVTLWLQLAPSGGAKPGAPGAPLRPGAVAGQPGAAAPVPINPQAAERQRQRQLLRQQRLQQQQQRGGAPAPPTVPPGIPRLGTGKGA